MGISVTVLEEGRFFVWTFFILGIVTFARSARGSILVIVVAMSLIGAKVLKEH
jgi:hypothetical protein